MPIILNHKTIPLTFEDAPMPEYAGFSSEDVSKLAGLNDFTLHIQKLEPGQFSCPYHFHHHAEEMFVILSGEGTLRTEAGLTKVNAGDILLFEEGKSGSHQLANEGKEDLMYMDLKSRHALDICEYPDTNKVNILPSREKYFKGKEAEYFQGEEELKKIWEKLPQFIH